MLKKTPFSVWHLAIFALVFVGIGSFLLWRVFAAGPLVASLQAEQMQLPPGGSIIPASAASRGKAVILKSNGTARGTVYLPSRITGITAVARGSQCYGSPSMTIAVDNQTVMSRKVVRNKWTSFASDYTLSAGNHNLTIRFSADYAKRKNNGQIVCDRNLFLDVTNFYGPVAVVPQPTVALSVQPTTVNAGESATLTWNSTNANSCLASGDWSGSQPTSGSVSTGALNADSVYNLTCTGDRGIASAFASVKIATQSSIRTEYKLGNPAYGSGGWLYDGTSTGWIRQAGTLSHLYFVSTPTLVSGWPTLAAQINPNDPVLYGGQRAQVYSNDNLLAKYGSQPSLETIRGKYRWYGFVFQTSAGYKPQNSSTWPNWNGIFSWHDTNKSDGSSNPQANVSFGVATKNYTKPGYCSGYTPFSDGKLRLTIDLTGGNPNDSNWYSDDSDNTCRRWVGPVFEPGRRYAVQMGIKWGDSKDGSLEVWIDGVQYASVSGVSTMWRGAGVYPVFENYRPGPDKIGNVITWTNTIYYAGLAKGSLRGDVAL